LAVELVELGSLERIPELVNWFNANFQDFGVETWIANQGGWVSKVFFLKVWDWMKH